MKPPTPLLLVVSGDTAGWIIPCGCATNQSGGLLRRGEYIDQLSERADVIYVDAGGAPSGTAEYDVAKFEAILRGERAMGLAVHNIGAAEAALGADELRRLEKAVGEPLFLSANVSDEDGNPIAQTSHIASVAGRRVLITGVLSQDYESSGLHVAPPRVEILKELKKSSTAGGHDYAIVLAYAPEAELRELARQLPEVDAIIGGPTGQAIAPERIGSALLAAATNKGKFLVELALPANSKQPLAGKVVEITESYENHAEQQRNLKEFHALLAESDFTPEQTSFGGLWALPSGSRHRFAGSQACRDCHADDCQAWDDSGHSRAWATLKGEGAHVDSYCQQCHVTGYGLPGGFASAKRTATRVNVGCESCHGPSQAHTDDPAVRTAYFGDPASSCIVCHDRENSPHFDYDTYWPKIKHGLQGG